MFSFYANAICFILSLLFLIEVCLFFCYVCTFHCNFYFNYTGDVFIDRLIIERCYGQAVKMIGLRLVEKARFIIWYITHDNGEH